MSPDQAVLQCAIFNPKMPHPKALTNGQGQLAGRRFNVYRNNVFASLIGALEIIFPVLRDLIGAKNFKTLATEYLQLHAPRSPLIMAYGTGIPDYLATYPPTRGIGYLPDTARLELAMRESYHAKDAEITDANALIGLSPECLANSKVSLVPSVRLVSSNWPICAIWSYNVDGNTPRPEMNRETALVLRPEWDPELHVLTPAGGEFVSALLNGQSIGKAIEASTSGIDAHTVERVLALLIEGNAVADVKRQKE